MQGVLGSRYATLIGLALAILTYGLLIYNTERAHARALSVEENFAPGAVLHTYGSGYSSEGSSKAPVHKRQSKNVQPASNDVYDLALKKGKTLVCWMQDPSLAGDLSTSQWTKVEQLKEWGWVSDFNSNAYGERDNGVKDLVQQDVDDWTGRSIRWGHKKDTAAPDGKSYPATDAKYQNNYYPKSGVILGDFNWGPISMIDTESTPKGKDWDISKDNPPLFKQLSDVWWIDWLDATSRAQQPVTNLKYIIQHNVVNEISKSVLARFLQKQWPNDSNEAVRNDIAQGRAPAWPGKVITREMEDFGAVLGTNNVWGIPYLLIQRHKELGKMRVKSITAWNEHPDLTFYQPNLIVELEAVDG